MASGEALIQVCKLNIIIEFIELVLAREIDELLIEGAGPLVESGFIYVIFALTGNINGCVDDFHDVVYVDIYVDILVILYSAANPLCFQMV